MLFVEVFLFNLPFWQTRNAVSEQAVDVAIGSGFSERWDGSLVVTNPKKAWREIAAPGDGTISYLYIDHAEHETAPDLSPSYDSSWETISWRMETRKSTGTGWYPADSEKQYSPGYENSRYFHIGNGTGAIRIQYNKVKNGDVLARNSFTVNPRVPYHTSVLRVALEILVALTVIAFRPGSGLYKRNLRLKDPVAITAVGVTLAIEIMAVTFAWYLAGGYSETSGIGEMPNGTFLDFDQYKDYANALLLHHSGLSFPVNSDFAGMANPYDPDLRSEIARHSLDKTPILFDVAFKSGRYYVYFGVLPALLLFAPYKFITGNDLSTTTAILVFAIAVIVASMILVIQLARWFGKKGRTVSLGSVLLASVGFFIGTSILSIMQQQLFYQLPQTLGLALSLLALSCWIEAKLRSLNKFWLALGSTFMALTLASRPQFILAAVLALPLFWDDIVGLWKGGLHNRQGLLHEVAVWVSVLLPFLVVFVPVLMFNKIRFGSLFDFGANYNLTGYDMTNNNLPWTQLVPLLFLYFFQTPNISTAFPFVHPTSQPIPLWLPMQMSHGGLFVFIAPFALAIFSLPFWRRQLKKSRTLATCAAVCVLGIVVAAFDLHIVGYDVRYILDFGWLFMILYAFVIFSADSERQWPTYDFLTADVAGFKASLPALSRVSRLLLGAVMVGLVLAWLNWFFAMFGANATAFNRDAWWDVSSWFLFI